MSAPATLGRSAVCVILLIGIGAGCGGAESTTSTSTVAETPQALPKLPPGWKARRDSRLGYAIGIPPGWEATGGGGKVLFRSPDHLVAMTLAVDRNPDALDQPLGQLATQTLAALPGFKAPLEPAKPSAFRGTPLQGVQTTATGDFLAHTASKSPTPAKSGVRERATLVVLRRDSVVNYSVAVLANAAVAAAAGDRAVALRMVRTLRDQPVEVAPPP